jgi:hypothetical protein
MEPWCQGSVLLFDWVGLIVQNIAVKKEFNQELRVKGWLGFLKLLAFPNRLQKLTR